MLNTWILESTKSLHTFPCSIGKTTIVLTYLISLCVEHMDSLSHQNHKFCLHTFPCSIGKATMVLAYLINLCVEHIDFESTKS